MQMLSKMLVVPTNHCHPPLNQGSSLFLVLKRIAWWTGSWITKIIQNPISNRSLTTSAALTQLPRPVTQRPTSAGSSSDTGAQEWPPTSLLMVQLRGKLGWLCGDAMVERQHRNGLAVGPVCIHILNFTYMTYITILEYLLIFTLHC